MKPAFATDVSIELLKIDLFQWFVDNSLVKTFRPCLPTSSRDPVKKLATKSHLLSPDLSFLFGFKPFGLLDFGFFVDLGLEKSTFWLQRDAFDA